MSEVMEKTFSSVSGFIMTSLGSRNMDVSPGFHNLVRSIRRAYSKTEEEKIVQKELELLKLKLQQPDTNVSKIKEYLIRVMYCEVLGHTASFSYIHAIKLAQHGSLPAKRIGYLAVSLSLHENHELILLLVNTIQRDLISTNMMHNCMALTAVCRLIGPEMVPAVLPLVEEKLKHSKPIVRKKAVMALRALYTKAPHMLQTPDVLFKQALCDRDAGVTSAALYTYSDLVQENPAGHKHLVRPLVALLRQVAGRKLSSDFEYHGVPAPWTQIRILRMLARLGAGDEHYSSLMYDLLEDLIQQTSALSHNIAYAVQYECLVTAATIYPQEQLLTKAAQCVGKFLKSFNHNLKYMGICALSALLKSFPSCATEHQLTVIDCLDDTDDTIRLKTLDLLFRMTTVSNVEVICNRLLTVLDATKDAFIRSDLQSKIMQLAQEYQPTVTWYLDTMTQVLLRADSQLTNDVVNRVISTVAEDSKSSENIGKHALQLYMPLVKRANVASQVLKIGCWVLGEFADLSSAPPATEIISNLCFVMDRKLDENLMIWAMSAMLKVISSSGLVSDDVLRVIKMCKKGDSMELKQRACELEQLCNDKDLMKEVHSKSNTDREFEVDWTLSFLDEYVSEALAQGAAAYKPKQQRHAERQLHKTQDTKPLFSGLNFVPYESPTASVVSGATASTSTPGGKGQTMSISPDPSLSSGTSGNSAEPKVSQSSTGLKLDGVKRVWGQQGYSKAAPTTRNRTRLRSADSHEVSLPTGATLNSPNQSAQPSVQLSSATALGRTASSQVLFADTPSEEDLKKKELARALFGGLHKTMTSNNKRPMDRKPHLPQTTDESPKTVPEITSSTSKTPNNDTTTSETADLLLLEDLNTEQLTIDSLDLNSTQLQHQNSNLPLGSKERQTAATKIQTPQEPEYNSRSELENSSGNLETASQEVLIEDGRTPNFEVLERTTSDEKLETRVKMPQPTNSAGHSIDISNPKQSIYDAFKGLDSSENSENLETTDLGSKSNREDPTNFDPADLGAIKFGHGEVNSDYTSTQEEVLTILDDQNSTKLSVDSESKPDPSMDGFQSKDNLTPENISESIERATPANPQSEVLVAIKSTPDTQNNKMHDLDSSPSEIAQANCEKITHLSLPDPPQNLLPEDWNNFPKSRLRVELCSDSMLAVTLYKVWKPDFLGLAFYVTNISPKNAITELWIKLEVSSNLKVLDDQAHLSRDTIDPSTTCVLTAELCCVAPAVNMSLGGEVTYKDHTKTIRRVFFNSPVLVSELLRPLELKTNDFGEKWPRQTHECRVTVEVAAAPSMSKVMTLLTQEMNLHLVEIIGTEAIACATLLNGPICLVHVKLPTTKSVELWVRSNSQLLCDSIAKQFKDDVLKTL